MRMHYPLCVLLVAVPALVSALPTNCIVGCKCGGDEIKLKIRDCDSPLVLTKDALQGVSTKVATIQFKNVVITRVESDALEDFDKLEMITIEDSSIGSIHSAAFDLPELRTITFTKTTFGEIPNLACSYLEELIFDDCKLSQVPNLENLPALIFLNVANNNIHTINESTFLYVDRLEEVTLSNNSISKLPPNLFATNSDFNTLNVDYNPLESFNLNFGSNIELLSVRYCNLTTFDRQSSKNLSAVTSLDLSGNQISVLPIDAFEIMKELNFIDLSNNKLVELDDDIFFENSKLDRIVLDNNQFKTLPNFQSKTKFQTVTFSCKNCGLETINVFENMQALVRVYLSNNNIKTIDGAFTEIRGLKELSLSNNKITTISTNAFSKDSQLETLDLSNNPLSPLDPVALATISSLKTLNITGCNLSQLWTNYNANLPSLEGLLVENNLLTVLTVNDIKVTPNLKVLTLKGNPLLCTEDLNRVVQFFVIKSIYPKDTGLLTTHEELKSGSDEPYDPIHSWQAVFDPDCSLETFNEEDVDSEMADDDDDDDQNDSDDDLNYDSDFSAEKKKDMAVEESILDNSGFNLARASYILSITSVFILTALLVLVVAVVVTLLILKRNRSFNMHNGNLPRLKIPLWHTTLGQKKHSGSVYRPLSEELSGPRTPIINRYEFKQTPQVHNSVS